MPDPLPPTGTVTFLFTDIEGSTRLWEERAAAMPAALARHDTLVRAAIERYGGHVFKTVGDAFCAAFAAAPSALAAAAAAQRALLAEPWPETGPILARIALYTGQAERRGDDYFGRPLNRADRFLTAMHGGQILVSAPTAARAAALPPGATLRDLGEHRFKGIAEPERVYQLVAPDLPVDFPPLATLPRRFEIDAPPGAPLVGRDDEAAAVHALVGRPDVRLVTLTGPGGVGKTRLARRVGAETTAFRDGACFVPLDAVTDPALVLPTIAQLVGAAPPAGGTVERSLAVALGRSQVLLVLDNFEHLAGAAPALESLLGECPGVTVLVTSRTELGVGAEHEFPVPPLAVPGRAAPATAAAIADCEAVALFVARARAARPDFALTDADAPAVAAICRRLDGLPLAIELAAARIKLLPPRAMAARLDRSLDLLAGGGAALPARQRTMRAALDWGYALLSPAEQAVFRRLAVFAGGASLEAAEAVCPAAGDPGAPVLDALAELVDDSLLRRDDGPGGELRLTVLETVREYAQERLAASGEEPATRAAHARHYLDLADRSLADVERTAWRDRLEADYDNLRLALAWWLDRDEGDPALRLGLALWPLLEARGQLTDGRAWLRRALSFPSTSSPLRAEAARLVEAPPQPGAG